VITQNNPSSQVDIPVEAVTVANLSAASAPAENSVSGVVAYPAEYTLPGDAEVVVQLADISLQDAAAQIIAVQTITNPVQIPIPFNLFYDPAAIDPGHNYAVAARISDGGGNALFQSTANVPVITQGNPTAGIQVLVEPIGATQLPGTASVSGVITYREQIALPTTARATVRIVNLSQGDSSLGIIAEQTISNPGQVPIPFELKYDPSRIDQNLLYSIKASIDDGSGNMLFVTTRDYLVITQRNPVAGIEVVLDRIFKGLGLCLPEGVGCVGAY
jgi:putative lipoprotein